MQGNNPELIPPSMFQSTRPPPDPWKDLAKVSEEVHELRRETEKLRTVERTKEPVILRTQLEEVKDALTIRRNPCNDEFKYANELISRQANEISELKTEVRQLRQKHDHEQTLLNTELAEKEKAAQLRITSLESVLSQKEDSYDEEVGRLSYEHQQRTERLTDKISTLSNELKGLQDKSESQVNELKAKIKSAEEEKNSTDCQLSNNLRDKETTIENLNKQVEQLKCYIGDNEKTNRPTLVWRKENDTLTNKLQICEADQENLKSKNELLNVRLSSINQILSVQEAEISKSKLDVNSKKNLESILLTRWREKVFSLLVQNKSEEMYSKKSENGWSSKYNDLQEDLDSAKSEIKVLKHQLSEKSAQIDLEKMNTKNVLVELSTTQQVAVCLDNQITENSSHFELLKSVAESVDNKLAVTMKNISSTLSMLKSYGDRISFASGRVELLQGQFARKEALRKLELGAVSEPTGVVDSGTSESHIVRELERVTRERDHVTGQLKQVSEILNDKLLETKQTYQNEIKELKQSVEDLELRLQEKSRTCESLSDKLEEQDMEIEEMRTRLDGLLKELGRQKVLAEQAVENELDNQKEKSKLEMSELERQVSVARRDQTKAVISLRQLERQNVKEIERLNEQIKIRESHYKKEIDSITDKYKTMEKERNLMMTTLRQEGLFSKYKEVRGEQLTEENKQQQEEVVLLIENQPLVSTDKTEGNISEPKLEPEAMKDVIEDLKSLAAGIDDHGSDSDESSILLS